MNLEDYILEKLDEPLFCVNEDVIRGIKFKVQYIYNNKQD